MERLTERSHTGTGIYKNASREPEKWQKNRHEVLQRLADYEDTNLTPEQIVEIDRLYREKCEELAKLQKKMPRCNLGDNIWVISKSDKRIKSGTIYQICSENGIITYYSDVYVFADEDINVDVFLVEEEAEQALAELKGE